MVYYVNKIYTFGVSLMGTQERRERERLKRRREILDAARVLFAQRGFNHTRIEDIA